MNKTSIMLLAAISLISALLLTSCKKEVVPELSLSESTLNFDINGGEKVVTVKSNVEWKATADQTWVAINPSAGNGEGSFTLSISKNEAFEARVAQVTVTAGNTLAKTISISQLGVEPALLVTPETIDVEEEGGDYVISVVSNTDWTVSIPDGVDWCVADKASGTGNTEITLTVSSHKLLSPRITEILFKEEISGSTVSVTVTQQKAAPSRYTDSLALVNLYELSGGETWAKNNWDLSQPMDTWAGIRLNTLINRVDSLKFGTKTIKDAEWALPENIGDLTELICLSLPTNMVTGELPASIYELRKLKTLELSGNTITGGFQPEMGQWTEMTYITMLNNKDFGGTIPSEIGNLKKLFRLNLSNTSITGNIPTAIEGCESMQEFMIFGAKLTGELPDIWDKFKNSLKIIMLYGNEGLTGPLPKSLGNVVTDVTTFSIHLYNCNFTGNIPESYATLPDGCKQLRIQGNKLEGEVPAAVKAHKNWDAWKASQYIFPQQEGYGLY